MNHAFQPTHRGLYHASLSYRELRIHGFTGKGGGEAHYGAGTYFSTDAAQAHEILALMQSHLGDVEFVRADAQVLSPFRVNATVADDDPDAIMKWHLEAAGLEWSPDPEKVTAILIAAGYDGVEVTQPGRVGMAGGSQVLVFSNNQIRVCRQIRVPRTKESGRKR